MVRPDSATSVSSHSDSTTSRTEEPMCLCATTKCAVRDHSFFLLPFDFTRTCAWTTAISCNNDFSDGGWALVRRVRKGTTWYNSTDNLIGKESFGITTSKLTEDRSFSIPYNTWITPNLEFLFSTGKRWFLFCFIVKGGIENILAFDECMH